jgi:hypothetical protein
MATLISIPSSAGDVLIEVREPSVLGGAVRGAPSDAIQPVASTFEESWARIRPVADTIINQVKSLSQDIDQIDIKFGVKFTADAKLFIAAASTEANFSINITWRRP